MEAQVVFHLAGGIAEAMHRGAMEVLKFAEDNCCIEADLEGARPVLADLYRLTCRHHDERHFAHPTQMLLLRHWSAVAALASALIEDRRIEGERVERIIDHGLSKIAP